MSWLSRIVARISVGSGASPTPKIADFRILFRGSTASFEALSRFYAKLALTKQASSNSGNHVDVEQTILAPGWIDLLSENAFSHVTSEGAWSLEGILEGILNAEYELKEIVFLDGQGHIRYDPQAFPFSLDPLKALVEAFGLEVCADTFWDEYVRLHGVD